MRNVRINQFPFSINCIEGDFYPISLAEPYEQRKSFNEKIPLQEKSFNIPSATFQHKNQIDSMHYRTNDINCNERRSQKSINGRFSIEKVSSHYKENPEDHQSQPKVESRKHSTSRIIHFDTAIRMQSKKLADEGNSISKYLVNFKSPKESIRSHSTNEIVQITERLYQEHKDLQKKSEKLINQDISKFKEECPFQPKSSKRSGSKRPWKEFLDDQNKFVVELETKREKVRSRAETMISYTIRDHPEISKNSQKLAEKRRKKIQNDFPSKPKRKSCDLTKNQSNSFFPPSFNNPQFSSNPKSQETWKPRINKKSKLMKREDSVCEILYNDAKRRIDKGKVNESKNAKPEICIPMISNKKSPELLLTKFDKQFNDIVKEYQEPLGYLEFSDCLTKLQYLDNENSVSESIMSQQRSLVHEGWKLLENEIGNGISKSLLRVFLLAVEGLALEAQRTSQDFDSEDGSARMGINEITKKDAHSIQRKFFVWKHNRMIKLSQKSSVEEQIIKPVKINQNSEQLSQVHRSKIINEMKELVKEGSLNIPISENLNHADLLKYQGMMKECYLNEARNLKSEQIQKECSFKPKINEIEGGESKKTSAERCELLFQQSLIKRDLTKNLNKGKNHLEAPTKTSEVINTIKNEEASNNPIFNETPKSKLSFDEEKWKSTQPMQPDSDSKVDQNKSSSLSLPIKSNNKTIEPPPILFVDINIAPGKSKRISIFEGEKAIEIAEKFALENSFF